MSCGEARSGTCREGKSEVGRLRLCGGDYVRQTRSGTSPAFKAVTFCYCFRDLYTCGNFCVCDDVRCIVKAGGVQSIVSTTTSQTVTEVGRVKCVAGPPKWDVSSVSLDRRSGVCRWTAEVGRDKCVAGPSKWDESMQACRWTCEMLLHLPG